ncbi:SGNH/GDSL hydrolase family protein [Aeromonas veronii]|uniref:SGNH/GDSL hydrolase family protein n=1 Tax=Aeromonas veronii TaxID=654 RepID=UPI00300405B0
MKINVIYTAIFLSVVVSCIYAVKSLDHLSSYFNYQHLKNVSMQNSDGWVNGRKGVVILGDSISHGAFTSDIMKNGWVRKLNRLWQSKMDTESYGFVPMLTIAPGKKLQSKDIHSIGFVNVESGWKALSPVDAGKLPNGFAMRSINTGNEIKIHVPNFQDRMIIHHANQIGGGSFTVYVNGVKTAEVNTGADDNKFAATYIPFKNDNLEYQNISLHVNDSRPVDILGFSYVSGEPEPIVQNMSQSGRRLRYVSSSVVDKVFQDAAVVILALGQNDFQETDENYKKETRLVIDQMILAAIKYDVKVVVNDFCWTAGKDNWLRIELARLAISANGTYIPYPDIIAADNNNVVADVDFLVSKKKMWVDGSHPNILGNEFIYDQFVKYTKWM